MLVNLVNRYGVMPKKCFPESFSSESSGRMNSILKSKVITYAIFNRYATGSTITSMMFSFIVARICKVFAVHGI